MMKQNARFRSRYLNFTSLLVLCVMLVAGCDYLPVGFTSLKEINANPATYEGKEVKIRGTVKEITKVPLIDIKAYVIQDEGAEITIFTSNALPAAQEKVALKGVVESAAILGGQSIGLHVKELQRLKTL